MYKRQGELQRAILLGVDTFEANGTGREVVLHRGRLAVDDDDMIVFLQRQGNFVLAVEGNEFRFRIFAGDIGKARQRDICLLYTSRCV